MRNLLYVFGFILCILFTLFLFSTSGEYYRTYSPDKQYSVYASKYNYEIFLFKFGGQTGDASGKVFLFDEITKKVINHGKLIMISLVIDIEWTETTAYFKGDANYPNILHPWVLPRKIKVR